jgi:hypothetical protein
MKKLLITAVISVAIVLCAALPSSAARVEKGFKFGGNVAFLVGAGVEDVPFYGSDWVLRFGLCGGGFVALPFSKSFALQAEALITTKGSKQLRPLFEDYPTYVYSLMITYLEIPVLARLSIPRVVGDSGIFFMAGPALAFKLHSRLLRDKEVLDYRGVKSNDLGLVFSAGSELASKSAGHHKGWFELRYTAGMSKIIEQEGVLLNVRNSVFSLIVGFSF